MPPGPSRSLPRDTSTPQARSAAFLCCVCDAFRLPSPKPAGGAFRPHRALRVLVEGQVCPAGERWPAAGDACDLGQITPKNNAARRAASIPHRLGPRGHNLKKLWPNSVGTPFSVFDRKFAAPSVHAASGELARAGPGRLHGSRGSISPWCLFEGSKQPRSRVHYALFLVRFRVKIWAGLGRFLGGCSLEFLRRSGRPI